jgi:NAD(P)-dependent dehydrogenase (short-subunit alcohol dehydrogenase family)
MRRVAIVTAAAQGIGLASARQIAPRADLVLADVQGAMLEARAEELRAAGAKVLTFVGDVQDPRAVAEITSLAKDKLGRLDILVNVVGGSGASNVQQIDEISPELWDEIIALNLRTVFLTCRAAVPIMRAQSYGRIVNTSSTLARGRSGPVGTAGARLAYAAAKSGILGFTAQLAKDVAQFGITANAVMPWLTLSDAGSKVRERYEVMPAEEKARLLARAPMNRPAEADEIGAAVAFLASEEASYVSGVGLPVDGAFL